MCIRDRTWTSVDNIVMFIWEEISCLKLSDFSEQFLWYDAFQSTESDQQIASLTLIFRLIWTRVWAVAFLLWLKFTTPCSFVSTIWSILCFSIFSMLCFVSILLCFDLHSIVSILCSELGYLFLTSIGSISIWATDATAKSMI